MSKSNTSEVVEQLDLSSDGPRALVTETELGVLTAGPDSPDVTQDYYWVVKSRVKARAERFAEEFDLIDAEHSEAAEIIRAAVCE